MGDAAHIMFVDDDRDTGEFLQEKLSFQICKAARFQDPRKALADLRRGHYRWTLTRLAHKTRLSKSLISQLENGKNSPSFLTLLKLPVP